MATREDLVAWVDESLRALGGSASLVAVAREIWQRHEPELRASGDLFYTWQYDMRWAAHQLRQSGRMQPEDRATNLWVLSS